MLRVPSTCVFPVCNNRYRTKNLYVLLVLRYERLLSGRHVYNGVLYVLLTYFVCVIDIYIRYLTNNRYRKFFYNL
jgi:hypothetical protein